MSKKVFICKNFINETKQAMGNSRTTTPSSPVQLAFSANGITLKEYPNLVQIYPSTTTDTMDLCTSGYGEAPAKTTRMYWKDAKLQIYNNNSSSTYTSSYLYQHRRDFNIHFIVDAGYIYDGITYLKSLSVICNGANLPSGNSFGIIPFTAQFPNLLSTLHINDNTTIYIPLSEIQVRTDIPAVSKADGTSIDTAAAIEIIKSIPKIYATTIQGCQVTPNISGTLFSGILPSPDKGRIFLTRFKVAELANVHCMYSYSGKQNTKMEVFPEPSSEHFIKNQRTEYDIYECTTSSYRNPNKFTNMLAHEVNSVSSSFWEGNNALIVRPDSSGVVKTYNTGTYWSRIETLAWFDCVFIRAIFERGASNWYTLAQCLTEGIPTESGDVSVKIEILLPDLCSLTYDSQYNNYTLFHLNDLYPYNPLEVTLEMGYQSDNAHSTLQSTSGIYIDNKKLRRLFIDKKEIEYFVVDESSTQKYTLIASGTTSNSGITGGNIPGGSFNGTYYPCTVSKIVPDVVASANIVATTGATETTISFTNNIITVYFKAIKPNTTVSATIEYTMEE